MNQMKWMKQNIKLLFFIVFLCIFFNFNMNVIYGETNPYEEFSMTISYGLEDTAKYGRGMVVYAKFYGISIDIEGMLTVTLVNDGNQSNVKYGKQVTLVAGKNSTVAINTDLNSNFTHMQVIFENEQEILMEQTIDLNVYNFNNYTLCGIISNFPEEFDYFSDFGSKLFYLNEKNLPETEFGLDMLDLIIIEKFDTSQLSQKQQVALIRWVENGGTLLLGQGAKILEYENTGRIIKEIVLTFDLDDTDNLHKLKDKIIEYENMRESIVFNIESIRQNQLEKKEPYLGKTMIRFLSDISFVPIKKEIIEILQEDFEVILKQDEHIIFLQKNLNNGKIIFSSIMLSQTIVEEEVSSETITNETNTNYKEITIEINNDLRQDEVVNQSIIEIYICNFIQNNISTVNKERITFEYYGYLNNHWVSDILSYMDVHNIPSTWILMFLLILYLILLAPITHIVLKRFQISKYIFGVVPLLAILFTLIIYAVGASTRIKEPVYGYLDVKYADSNKESLRGRLDFYVSLPYNHGYTFMLENTNHVTIGDLWIDPFYSISYVQDEPLKSVPLDYTKYVNHLIYKNEGVEVKIGNIPAFKSSYFNTTYETEYVPIVDIQLSLSMEVLEGKVENLLDITLEDVAIISNYLFIPLGDIKGKETISIYQPEATSLLSPNMAYDIYKFTNEEFNELPSEELRMRTATQMVIYNALISGGDYLIGFTSKINKDNPIAEYVDSKNSFGTSLYVIKLKEEENEAFVPNIEPYKTEVMQGSYIDTMKYMSSEELIINYAFPETDQISEIVLLQMLNHIPWETTYYKLANNVYFYNYSTYQYDLVFRCESGFVTQRVSGTDLSNYLSDNTLIVKYQNTQLYNLCMLPVISYQKEDQ